MTTANILAKVYMLMFATALGGVICALILIIQYSSKEYLKYCSTGIALIAYVMGIYFIVDGGKEGFSSIWICLYPFVFLLIMGRKQGNVWSILSLITTTVLLRMPPQFISIFSYTQTYKNRFPIVIAFALCAANISEMLRWKTQERLIRISTTMKQHAATDTLTKLGNRNAFNEFIQSMLEKSDTACFAIVDIDYFKRVNDTYGHAAGDEVLVQLANVLMQSLRRYDGVFRWGGEEFLLITDSFGYDNFNDLLWRICKRVENTKFKTSVTETPLKITVSIGGVYNSGLADYTKSVALADKNLYEAKNSGRNRVVCSSLANSMLNKQYSESTLQSAQTNTHIS